MRTTLRITFAAIAIGSLLAACGGDPEGTGTDPVGDEPMTTGGETGAEPSADLAWEDMDFDQRKQFMAETVMPEMQAMFTEFDAERFGGFGCDTCHGANMEDVGFEMPNGVAPLDPAQIPAMFESEEPMAVFMTQRVWPRMAEMLGEELYNQETHEGFACMNCHATAEGGAAK